MDARTELGQWFNECHDEFRGFLCKLVADPHLAEDIMQETYVKAFLKFHLFKPERGSLKNWLYRIAINTFYDHERFSRNERAAAGEIYAESSAARDGGFESEQFDLPGRLDQTRRGKDSAVGGDRVEAIGAAMRMISPEKRLLVLLSVSHTMEEISEMISVPAGTVKSRLFYARKELKAIFQKILKEDSV